MSVIGKCPKCNKNIIETPRGYSCEDKEGCGFHLNYHNLAGLGVPFVKKSIIKKLLKNPDAVVELKARESGKSYKKKAWLYKGEQYKAWTIVVDDDFHNEIIGECPKCSSLVQEYSKVYKCTNESCNFKIWKNYKGSDIKIEDAKRLLKKETIVVECISQKNKKVKWKEYIWISNDGFIESEKE